MMRRPKTIHVGLTGGLGNQLFQITTAMCLTSGNVIVVDCLGSPRGNQGISDSSSLSFPERVKFHKCEASHIVIQKIFSLLISMTVTRNQLNRCLITRLIVYFISGVFLSFHLKCLAFPRIGNGTGYDEFLRNKRGNFLIGYFQTFLYIKESLDFKEISAIKVKSKTQYLKKMEQLSRSTPISMIHVRLGDYKNEPSFGTLEANYYQKAVNLLSEYDHISTFWLFSDEANLAIKLLPSEIRKSVTIIETEGISAAETLELMKNCQNYLLANSTLGWWGAFMGQVKSSTVIAPDPWFARSPSPKFLIPDNWLRVNRFDQGD